MTWQPLDCHAHTTMSDGALDPDALVRVAAERGVRPSVADHISRDVASAVKSIAQVAVYLDTLDDLAVCRGGEFCWHDDLWRELPDSLARRFTHRIGSLHAIWLPDGTLVHAFSRRVPAGLTPGDYMEAHLANLARLAREMPIDILAHPTLLPLPWRQLPLEELWTEEREERAVELLRDAGIAFEISNRYRPHERFVRRAVSAGVRVSLGSDGHSAEQVAEISFPLAMARRLGVAESELYDPLIHGSRVEEPAGRPAA